MMKIGFIGAGKVGYSLGKFFCEHNVKVTGYYNRHQEEALKASEFTATKCFEELKELIDESDAIFITVSDGAINSVYEQIKELNISGKYICHASGALSANDAFPDIEKYGAYGYSIHPLFPVSDKLTSYRKLSDAFFCIEGSSERVNIWNEMFMNMGAKVKIISSDCKVKYHAACAISSNLVCALIDESINLLNECDFTEDEAIHALEPLIRANIENILEKGTVRALTGPVERGDFVTVQKHIDCFATEEERDMYVGVTKRLVHIAERKRELERTEG